MKQKLRYRFMIWISTVIFLLENKLDFKSTNIVIRFLRRFSFMHILAKMIEDYSIWLEIFVERYFSRNGSEIDDDNVYHIFKDGIKKHWEPIFDRFMTLWNGIDSYKLYMISYQFEEGMTLFTYDEFSKHDMIEFAEDLHEYYRVIVEDGEVPISLFDLYLDNYEIQRWLSYFWRLKRHDEDLVA